MFKLCYINKLFLALTIYAKINHIYRSLSISINNSFRAIAVQIAFLEELAVGLPSLNITKVRSTSSSVPADLSGV